MPRQDALPSGGDMNEVETFVWRVFGGATITWHVAIDCFYDDHNRMGSVICINSISFRVKETYEELRYRLVDPVELQ